MPAVRGVYMNHPQTGVSGIWVDTSARGLVGEARTVWPAVGTSTLTQYGTTITSRIQTLVGTEVTVTIKFSALVPLTLDPAAGITITEGTSKQVKVGP